MTNPIKSQITANRERFDELCQDTSMLAGLTGGRKIFVKELIDTFQTSLLQTEIAAVEGMKEPTNIPTKTRTGLPEEWANLRNEIYNSALSKVVELLKGGIDN